MSYNADLTPLTEAVIDEILVRYNNAGYTMPKWISFSLDMLKRGFIVRYYDSKSTVSKYIYVKNPRTNIEVKVRFSNHKPNYQKEVSGDCDFYVGHFNNGIITTEKVIPLVVDRLTVKNNYLSVLLCSQCNREFRHYNKENYLGREVNYPSLCPDCRGRNEYYLNEWRD